MFGDELESADTRRTYKLTHQLLSIKNFNFENESIVGYVNMSFTPLSTDLKRIYINCQQCLIHRLSINDSIEPVYSYSDPTLDICQDKEHLRHNIENFETCHRNVVSEVNPDNGKGEICILIPEELQSSILDLKPFQVIIEFSLVKPKGGLKFVTKDADGTPLEKIHLFSYGHENSSRLWFPCIDSYSEVCTWKLEFTVSMYMTAVSCGELTETIHSSDSRQKIYHYYLSVPTAAPNIALAIGEFDVWVDPKRKDVTCYCCVPELTSVMKNSVSFVHKVFEFYEELLSTRYPYSCYKQVFVDMAYKDIIPYATMTICSINLLHSKKVIEQTIITQKLLSKAVAQQFFGCYISRNSWNDAWLTKGLASFLSALYQATIFGLTNRVYESAEDMRKVCEYELNMRPVLLDPSKNSPQTPENPHILSSAYLEIYELKSGLVMRLLDKLIGREFMLQVMQNLMVLASKAAEQKFTECNSWSNMTVSTESFANRILLATGRDISSFINQWVYQGGAIVLLGSFHFNKKRNVLELELRQDLSSKNSLLYAGPVVVAVQELDGTFCRQFVLEENKNRFDIGCHSKSRRQKKKKIPLWTGEEVDINLDDTNAYSAESPVLWFRIDPEMNLLRIVKLELEDHMWRHMLVHERCVVAQMQAIEALEKCPSDITREALIQTVRHEKFFPKIREAAAFSLMKVENFLGKKTTPSQRYLSLIDIFKTLFGHPNFPSVVQQNNFSNVQHYILQKALPLAISESRNDRDICPPEALRFLLDLVKYNNNSVNMVSEYSDCYYKSGLIDALANTLTQAFIPAPVTWCGPSDSSLTNNALEVLDNIILRLNVEKFLPSHKFCITASCLKAFKKLHSFGHISCNPDLFKTYAVQGNAIDVRLAALDLLADYAEASGSSAILDWIFDVVEKDCNPLLRFKIVQMFVENPPFKTPNSPLNTESLKERIWDLMNSGLSHDSRLRCAIVDLYKVLYVNSSKFKQISFVKEKKTALVNSMDEGYTRSLDGMAFPKKRKAVSPRLEERKLAKLNSWGENLPGPSYMMETCNSENSLDVFQAQEVNKDSFWSTTEFKNSNLDFDSSPLNFWDRGHPEHQHSGQEEEGGQLNLSVLSSSSSRESSPKAGNPFNNIGSEEIPHHGGSRTTKQLSSHLSDDDDGFEQFGSNNQTSSAVENDWMVNGVENGYGENAALNLSSDSEMSSRLSSSDEGDDG